MTRPKHLRQPYQIKGVEALFGEDSSTPTAAQWILLDQIDVPPVQPRRYFDPQAMEELIVSVKQYGILQPLIVRPKQQERYELVVGERRYRAAQAAALESVPVVVRELDDQEAWQLALLENLQREDLNPLEETEGILQFLAGKLNRNREAVISLLNQGAHPERESVDNVIHSQDWQLLLEGFNQVGKFTPESFRTNRLPLLRLPEEIQDSLRRGQIAYTKAKAIAGLKDSQQRQALLEEAVKENLSLSQIRERLRELKSQPEPSSPQIQIQSLSRRLNQSKLWSKDPQKWKRVQGWLAKIEDLLDG